MKLLHTAIALAIVAGPQAVRAAAVDDDGVMTLQAPSAQAAAAKPFAAASPPCGSASNNYQCISVNGSNETTVALPSYLRAFPAAGMAVVTWQGRVGCSASPRIFYVQNAVSATSHEYYLYLGLKDTATDLDTAGPDTVTVGEKQDLFNGSTSMSPPQITRIVYTPVTLTKAFPLAGPVSRRFRVALVSSFLAYGAGGISCSINGGVYTVQYTPK